MILLEKTATQAVTSPLMISINSNNNTVISFHWISIMVNRKIDNNLFTVGFEWDEPMAPYEPQMDLLLAAGDGDSMNMNDKEMMASPLVIPLDGQKNIGMEEHWNNYYEQILVDERNNDTDRLGNKMVGNNRYQHHQI